MRSLMQRRTIRNVHFLRLRGDMIERARHHARLLRSEIFEGAVPALAKKNEGLIQRGPGLIRNSTIQKALLYFYKTQFMVYLDRQSSKKAKDLFRVAEEETGIPYDVWRDAFFQADAMMVLAKATLLRHALSDWIPGGLPGCTSAVVLKDWTESGRLLACRNLDYPLVGPWERHPTVVFNEPTESGEIPFVSLTSAGIQTGGITSMNREGVTLFTHAHFGRTVSFQGKPIVWIGDQVIRKSKTLGEAIDEAKKQKTLSNWAFVVASAKENQAAVIQMTPNKVSVQESADGFLTHSNFFPDKELQFSEGLLSGAYCEDLQSRVCRMRQLMEAKRGHLQPMDMAAALGDHWDPRSGEERVFGNTISVITTVKSAVFDPTAQRFWISNRTESPVGLGDFLEVNVDRFWEQSAKETDDSMQVLRPHTQKNPRLIQAIHFYRQAYCAYHMGEDRPGDREQALAYLQKAVNTYPEDGHLWVQSGVLSFQLGQFSSAISFFEESRSRSLSDHVKAVRDLYLARCLDLTGQRARAIQLYARHVHLHSLEPKLKKAFKRGLIKSYQKSEISRMIVDLQFVDTFEY